VDGLDDLVGVDALEVDGGHAEVAVAELALDDVERHAFVSELDRMRVAKLVRREASADTGARGESAQNGARRSGLPRAPAGGAVDDAEHGSDRHGAGTVSQGSSCSKPQSSMPISRRWPPLPRRTRTEPRRRSRSSSVRSSASWMRRPERQRTTISAGRGRRGRCRRSTASRR